MTQNRRSEGKSTSPTLTRRGSERPTRRPLRLRSVLKNGEVGDPGEVQGSNAAGLVCPRCRAAGHHASLDDTSTCPLCGTSWQCGDVGQMIAVRHREAA